MRAVITPTITPTPSQAIVASIADAAMTAGEQIACAVRMFNGGTIGERELAATIDAALKVYR